MERPAGTPPRRGADGAGAAGASPRPAPQPPRADPAAGFDVRALRASLREAGVQGETLEVLDRLLMAAHPVARTAPAQMARLVDEAEHAVCRMLSGAEVPSPAAAQAAAHVLMTGIQTLPDGARRADAAAAAFLKTFDSVPRPSDSAGLPDHGLRLEATGLAILTAASRVPEDDVAIGLDVMSRFAGVMLEKITVPTGARAAADQQRLMDSVANLNAAVLRTIDMLPPKRRPEPLTHLAGHLPKLWCGIEQPEQRKGREVPYLRAAADLLAALCPLPVELRHQPLGALGRSIDATPALQTWPDPLNVLREAVARLVDPAYQPPDYHELLGRPIGPVQAPPAAPPDPAAAGHGDVVERFIQMMQASMQASMQANMWENMFNRPTAT
jgi:hypothetical protein